MRGRAVPCHEPKAYEGTRESMLLSSRSSSFGAVDVLVEVARPDQGVLWMLSSQLLDVGDVFAKHAI